MAEIGLGTWAMGGPWTLNDGSPVGWGAVDDDQSIRSIHEAIDNGATLFDTANVYGCGHSEEVLGNALKGRPDVQISSKFGMGFDAARMTATHDEVTEPEIRASVEASLRRLCRDKLEYLFFHLNEFPAEKAAPVFEVLEKLREEGKIDTFGWSTDFVDRAKVGLTFAGFSCVQFDLNLFVPAGAMRALQSEHGFKPFNRQPLGMGLLSDKTLLGERKFSETDIRSVGADWMIYFKDGKPNSELLEKLASVREHLTVDGRTVVQGALGWIWATCPDAVPIPGFRSGTQASELIEAARKGALPDDTLRAIEGILRTG